jgi:hypothetical protein
MPVDAAGLLVDEVDGQLRALGRAGPDVVGAALLVDEADRDRLEALVGRAGLAAHVLQVVGDAGADVLASDGLLRARLLLRAGVRLVIAATGRERRRRDGDGEHQRRAACPGPALDDLHARSPSAVRA